MRDTPGVSWAWALMATPANLEALATEGVTEGLGDVAANDLVLAARGADEHLPAALDRARAVLFEQAAPRGTDAAPADARPASLDEALAAAPGANVAIVSVPGPYAALEAHKALTRGLDVLLFSDNVPLPDEIDLKRRARSLGRLVMGPGAGTAALAGVGLGLLEPGGARAGGGGRRGRHRRSGSDDAARPVGIGRVPCHRSGRPRPVGRGLRRYGRGGHRGTRSQPGDRVDAAGVQAALGRGGRAPAGPCPQQAGGGRLDRAGPAGGRSARRDGVQHARAGSRGRAGPARLPPARSGRLHRRGDRHAHHCPQPLQAAHGGTVQRGNPGLRGDGHRQRPHRARVLQHTARAVVGAARSPRRPTCASTWARRSSPAVGPIP